MHRSRLVEPAIIFVLAYLSQLVLWLHYSAVYVGFLLPMYRWELSQFGQDYQIQTLSLGESHGEAAVVLTLLTRNSAIAGHFIPAGISITSSALVGYALQHPLLSLSVAVAWPASSLTHRMLRLCSALLLLLPVEIADIPIVLLGSVEDLLEANFYSSTGSLVVGWMNFMNGGGRLALSLFSGLVAVAVAKFFFPIRTPQRNTC